MTAAQTLRSQDVSSEITVVGDDPYGYYSRPGLAYYLTGEIPEKHLYILNKRDWRSLDLHLIKGRAVRIQPPTHQLELQASPPLSYDRLLLATGSTAVRLEVPGANLQGVVKLDDFSDALLIRRLARRARTAVVVGGGIVAMELVEGLKALGLKIHYFLRGDRYWPSVLDESESRIVEQRLHHEGVHLHYRTELTEILGRGGRVSGVRTADGVTLPCEILAAGIGIRSRLELARSAGLRTERAILTDEFLRTSDPDIYAAGDVAQVFNPSTGHALIDSLWNPARQQGTTAALNMSGQNQPYVKPTVLNIARLAGLITTVIGAIGGGRDDDQAGLARGSSETWQVQTGGRVLEAGSDASRLRLMVGVRTLLGALVIGDQAASIPLQGLIQHQIDITPIRDRLFQSNGSVAQTLIDFWSKVSKYASRE